MPRNAKRTDRDGGRVMFVVTNRNIIDGGAGFAQLGPLVNPKGPAELRMVEVVREDGGFRVAVLPDTIDDEMKASVGIPAGEEPIFASEYVFRRVMARISPRWSDPTSRQAGKDLLLFVHGFNNNFEDVAARCFALADIYPHLEIIAFTWPANGGGAKGVPDYLDDKRDAQASVVAFDRVLAKMHVLLARVRREALERLNLEARMRFEGNVERAREYVARTVNVRCPFNLTMMLHSMGNYLFERTLKSTALRGSQLLFDNIVMVAPDVNNAGHAEWLEQVQVRNRLYVTLNEDDDALQASRMKGGEDQQARLGHYTYNLSARNAVYIDFTNAQHVGTSHAYFEGEALANPDVRRFFEIALSGRRVEDAGFLVYDASRNLHLLSR